MNAWSRMRKRIILTIVLLAILLLVGLPLYLLFSRAPSCTDGVKNGDESGVDCGGSCRQLCAVESLPLITRGDPRVVKVSDDYYELVVVVENPNASAQVSRAPYTLKVYGADSLVPVKTIEGQAFVPRSSVFAIFEGPIDFSKTETPVRATLEWGGPLVWEKTTAEAPAISVDDFDFSADTKTPQLRALLRNSGLSTVSNIELTALLYDGTGSIFAASKTFVSSLSPNSEELAIFSWPEELSSTPIEVKILTRVLPDQSYLR